MKKLIILFLTVIATSAINAQTSAETANQKKLITIGHLNYATSNSVANVLTGVLSGRIITQDQSYMPAVRNGIVKGLSFVRRFIYKDVPPEQLRKEAQESGTTGYIADCTVTSLGSYLDIKSSSKTMYGSVTFSISLKNAVTDEVVTTKQFDEYYGLYGPTILPENAINNAIDYATSDVAVYFSSMFPFQGSIIEKGGSKSDKQKEVYINLGNNWSVYVGQKFHVYTVQYIAGREAKREIGKLKVKEVMGEDISFCKVTSGGSEIKKQLDQGATVIVVSQ